MLRRSPRRRSVLSDVAPPGPAQPARRARSPRPARQNQSPGSLLHSTPGRRAVGAQAVSFGSAGVRGERGQEEVGEARLPQGDVRLLDTPIAQRLLNDSTLVERLA